jgi:predicted cupin superfamily sugar epimerase/mannose-6-phosphate isomerase-like protein (cupin superfamily)
MARVAAVPTEGCNLRRHPGVRWLALGLAFALLSRSGAALGASETHAEKPPGMAGRLIAHFKMQRIPDEGAWFSVTYTSEDQFDGAMLPPRYAGIAHAAGGAIVALVTARDFSALHRLKTDETWHFYSGVPLALLLLYPDGKGRRVTLGTNVLHGEVAQFTVPRGVWQGAAPIAEGVRSYSFVGTQMAPAFDNGDFEIGYRDELQRRYPAFAKRIARLTRAEFVDSAGRPAGRPEASPPSLPNPPPCVFVADDIPAATASPGVTLRELVGRVAPLAKTAALSIAKFTLSPGQSSGASFNHRSQEVFLVMGGTGKVYLGDKVTPVAAESTVFIPAGEVHAIEADSNATLTFYAVSAPAYSPEDYVAVQAP